MNTPVDDEEFTALVDADIPRVDLVDKAANGTTFLIAKAQGAPGLLSPDLVRDLIGKQAAEPDPEDDKVTMSGSPAAIAKLIHQAAVRAESRDLPYDEVVKAKYTADELRHMASTGAAMGNESYPIADREDLDRAIRAVGRGGSSHDAIRRHIVTRARSLGASSEIPDNWNKDGSLKGDVAKEMDMDDDALDAAVALAEPEDEYRGMDTDPGSPAWEAVDAATARKWLAILARAQNAIDMLAEREMLEAASADPDDAENAWDLQDACCAIDYAISVLAPFAVSEQAEADCGDDMQMVGKALTGFDAAQLDTIEALAPVAKAGRVLSAANEAAIRQAADSLQKVLASLPNAPTTEEVAKTANEESDMPTPTPSEDVTSNSGQAPAMGSQQADPKPVAGAAVTDMAKAEGAPEKSEMTPVYDAKGNLIGAVDPKDLTVFTSVSGQAASDDSTDGDSGEEPAADTETPDLTPEPPAEAGTPADAVPTEDDEAVAKNSNETDTTSEEVLKSIVDARVEAALAEYRAAQEQAVAKQADDRAHVAELIETLKGRVEALEEQPAEPRVFTNGVQPPRDLRGMDRGAFDANVQKALERRRSLYQSDDATEQNRIANDMQVDAIQMLREIQRG